MSVAALVLIQIASYINRSCGDGGFSAGLLNGASRAWGEALHTSGPSRIHISQKMMHRRMIREPIVAQPHFLLLKAALAVHVMAFRFCSGHRLGHPHTKVPALEVALSRACRGLAK